MISETDKDIVGKLDGIRRDRQKFLCLNDNMNHSHPDAIITKRALHALYEVSIMYILLTVNIKRK
jgi:UDP-N-acetylglucosamine-lysosomal-enzyme